MSFIGGNRLNTANEVVSLEEGNFINVGLEKDFIVQDGDLYLRLADSEGKLQGQAA
jgi:hypothetical protein